MLTTRQPHARAETRSRWFALTVLCSSILIVNLDVTVLNVALPTLVRDLHASSTRLQWIVDAYALVFGGLLLVAGSVADRLGRKPVLLAGLAVFVGGSAWAAFSGSVSLLISARASMGVGAAMMMPATLSIITDLFRDLEERRKAIGLWAGTSGVGFAVGPIVGGALLTHFWWGSVFLLNVPVGAVALLAASALAPNSKNPAALPPDYLGGALSMSGVGLLLWSIIEAPVDGWSSLSVITTGSIGIALLIVFAAWERATSHPMLNFGYLRERSFSIAVCSVALAMFALVGALFLLTQYLQFSLDNSPLAAGVRMLPVAGALAVVAPTATVLVARLGAKVTVAGGLLLITCGLWSISGATTSWTYVNLVPGMVLTGIGAALVMPTVASSVLSSVPLKDAGVGAGTNGACIQIGGALGVAVMGSAMSARYQANVGQAIAGFSVPDGVRDSILGSIGGALSVASHLGGMLGGELAGAARAAFLSGAGVSDWIGGGVALAGAALALLAFPMRVRDRSR